jgi:toxin ParE1/3/4
MSFSIEWLELAVQEAKDAKSYYENKSPAIANTFLEELQQTLQRLSSFPMAWPVVEEPVRKIRMNRFPYLIHYVFEKNIVLILGMYHLRRRPISWLHRLQTPD